jgi:hypothetical protein
MIARGIVESEVESVVAEPETTYPSADDATRTVILGKTKAKPPRRLKVVVRTADPTYVITVADRDDDR